MFIVLLNSRGREPFISPNFSARREEALSCSGVDMHWIISVDVDASYEKRGYL
jgi:hypothetical protein